MIHFQQTISSLTATPLKTQPWVLEVELGQGEVRKADTATYSLAPPLWSLRVSPACLSAWTLSWTCLYWETPTLFSWATCGFGSCKWDLPTCPCRHIGIPDGDTPVSPKWGKNDVLFLGDPKRLNCWTVKLGFGLVLEGRCWIDQEARRGHGWQIGPRVFSGGSKETKTGWGLLGMEMGNEDEKIGGLLDGTRCI